MGTGEPLYSTTGEPLDKEQIEELGKFLFDLVMWGPKGGLTYEKLCATVKNPNGLLEEAIAHTKRNFWAYHTLLRYYEWWNDPGRAIPIGA